MSFLDYVPIINNYRAGMVQGQQEREKADLATQEEKRKMMDLGQILTGKSAQDEANLKAQLIAANQAKLDSYNQARQASGINAPTETLDNIPGVQPTTPFVSQRSAAVQGLKLPPEAASLRPEELAKTGTAFKSFNPGDKTPESLKPAIASGFISRDQAKLIAPEIGDTGDISIGALKLRNQNPELSPEATKFWSDYVAQTGQLPANMGFGNAKLRGKLLEQGAKSATDQGLNPTEQQQTFKAQTAAKTSMAGNAKIQDAKVNQAIDLKALIDQSYNPETDSYSIPPSMHTELALGLARLLSPSGTVGIDLEEKLRQGTLKEKAANLAIFAGLDPAEVGGTTDSVARFFAHTIERQGQIAERLRDQYKTGKPSTYSSTQSSENSQTPKQTGITKEDLQALNWAKNNPTDPRAKAILQHNGAR